jgi:hypothetical protein
MEKVPIMAHSQSFPSDLSQCLRPLQAFILFFHAHLLRTCTHRDFPSELLYVMRVKMVRRLSKLGPAVSDSVYRSVHDAAKLTETLLSKRWTAFQNTESITIGPILRFKELDFVADTDLPRQLIQLHYEDASLCLTWLLSKSVCPLPYIPFLRSTRLRSI